jgi:hypothetical protein
MVTLNLMMSCSASALRAMVLGVHKPVKMKCRMCSFKQSGLGNLYYVCYPSVGAVIYLLALQP